MDSYALLLVGRTQLLAEHLRRTLDAEQSLIRWVPSTSQALALDYWPSLVVLDLPPSGGVRSVPRLKLRFEVPVLALLLATVGELVALLLNIYMVTIIVQVIISWVNPGTYNPVSGLLYSLNSPLLSPIQRLLPPIAGIDLSPLFALIGLQVLKMLILPLLG